MKPIAWMNPTANVFAQTEEAAKNFGCTIPLYTLPAEAPSLPAEPTHEMLKALAGDPVILAANHEEELRKRYAAMIQYVDDAAKKT